MTSQTQQQQQEGQEKATYKANCHCAQIKYTVADVSPPLEKGHAVMSCNCSICTRDGKKNIYIPNQNIHFVAGEDKIKRYHYGKLTHAFCPDCSTSLFCYFSDPNHEWAKDWAMNVSAFHGVDMSKLKFTYADKKDVPPMYDPGW